jgi:hypothetical protein
VCVWKLTHRPPFCLCTHTEVSTVYQPPLHESIFFSTILPASDISYRSMSTLSRLCCGLLGTVLVVGPRLSHACHEAKNRQAIASTFESPALKNLYIVEQQAGGAETNAANYFFRYARCDSSAPSTVGGPLPADLSCEEVDDSSNTLCNIGDGKVLVRRGRTPLGSIRSLKRRSEPLVSLHRAVSKKTQWKRKGMPTAMSRRTARTVTAIA